MIHDDTMYGIVTFCRRTHGQTQTKPLAAKVHRNIHWIIFRCICNDHTEGSFPAQQHWTGSLSWHFEDDKVAASDFASQILVCSSIQGIVVPLPTYPYGKSLYKPYITWVFMGYQPQLFSPTAFFRALAARHHQMVTSVEALRLHQERWMMMYLLF